MSIARANAFAVLWLPVAGALVLLPFVLVWGQPALGAGIVPLLPLGILLPLLAGSIVIHELLHAAGFLVLGRLPRKMVRVGIHRRTLTPYAACQAPVPAAVYRGAALLPAVVLGVVPGIVAVIFGLGGVAGWAAVMLALAGGDVAAVWAIRRVPARTMVLDHPSRVGCTVVRAASAPYVAVNK